MKTKNINKLKQMKLLRRKKRVRATIFGTSEAPRLSVKRSLKHITAQIIDDEVGKTLAYARDLDLPAKFSVGDRKRKVAQAYAVGHLLAERAARAGVTKVVFDRGGRIYHGRVAALAEGARDGGLQF